MSNEKISDQDKGWIEELLRDRIPVPIDARPEELKAIAELRGVWTADLLAAMERGRQSGIEEAAGIADHHADCCRHNANIPAEAEANDIAKAIRARSAPLTPRQRAYCSHACRGGQPVLSTVTDLRLAAMRGGYVSGERARVKRMVREMDERRRRAG